MTLNDDTEITHSEMKEDDTKDTDPNEEEKKRSIIKYCIAYKKSNRTNKCVKVIGRCLHQCEGTKADALFAANLLKMLAGE